MPLDHGTITKEVRQYERNFRVEIYVEEGQAPVFRFHREHVSAGDDGSVTRQRFWVDRIVQDDELKKKRQGTTLAEIVDLLEAIGDECSDEDNAFHHEKEKQQLALADSPQMRAKRRASEKAKGKKR
jgi:hypothetical protein